MSTDRLVAPLLRVPLFAGLKPLQITELARLAERVKFRRGDLITEAGRQGDGAFLIVSGPAERLVRPGFAAAAEPIEPGSLIGGMAMLVEHDYGATVIARDRVLCLKFTRAAVHAQMLEDPALASHFEGRIRERLAHLADELRQIDGILAACGTHALQPEEKKPDAKAQEAGVVAAA
jgi:signal-transduction protein with cAMP-binding, CBS, and nucleotidyltransferase domain